MNQAQYIYGIQIPKIYMILKYGINFQEDLRQIDSIIAEARVQIINARTQAPKNIKEETWPIGSSPAHYPATR